MITIEQIKDAKNLLSEFLEIHHSNYSIVLYGRGAGLTWYLKLLSKYKIKIDAIVETNPRGGNIYIENEGEIPCISLQDCHHLNQEPLFLISAPAHRKTISEEIKKHYANSKIFCFDATLEVIQDRTDDQSYKKFCIENYDKLQNLFYEMGDEKSKETFNAMILGGITNDINYYEKCAIDTMYFPDIIKKVLTDNEVFVDMGAFTGDSIIEFMNETNGKYKRIIAFEPDIHNFNLLKEYRQKENINNLEIYNTGCYSENRTIYFINSNGTADEGAHIVTDINDVNNSEATKIEVVKLDDVINEEISYMKMDIEGSELAALQGANSLINKYTPKLAISVYHKIEDIIELTDYIKNHIKNINGNYKLYLRHYWENAGSDTVLFAIFENSML